MSVRAKRIIAVHCQLVLGPFQTSNFTCAESNANEKNLLISLICIRFGHVKFDV